MPISPSYPDPTQTILLRKWLKILQFCFMTAISAISNLHSNKMLKVKCQKALCVPINLFQYFRSFHPTFFPPIDGAGLKQRHLCATKSYLKPDSELCCRCCLNPSSSSLCWRFRMEPPGEPPGISLLRVRQRGQHTWRSHVRPQSAGAFLSRQAGPAVQQPPVPPPLCHWGRLLLPQGVL